MKITIITNLYPPFVRGGAEYLAHQVAGECARQGHTVSIITTVPWQVVRSFRTQLQVEDNLRVYRFYPLNLYHYLSAVKMPLWIRFFWQIKNMFNWPAALVIKHILQTEQPDVVISFNLIGVSFLVPWVVSNLKIKHIHTLHDVQLLHPSGLFLWGESRNSLPERIYQKITRWLFKEISVVVSPSQWLLQEHLNAGFFSNSRQQVISNPVPVVAQSHYVKKPHTALKITYFGQFEKHKGVFWLLSSLVKLSRQDFKLHLIDGGRRPRVELVQRLAQYDKRVVVHGATSQIDIIKQLRESDLVIVPSFCYENAPSAITMAALVGTPVLASRIGGIPEMVDDGKTGWLFTPGDESDFLTKLGWCLNNPNALTTAGFAAQEKFVGRTLKSYAKDLLML